VNLTRTTVGSSSIYSRMRRTYSFWICVSVRSVHDPHRLSSWRVHTSQIYAPVYAKTRLKTTGRRDSARHRYESIESVTRNSIKILIRMDATYMSIQLQRRLVFGRKPWNAISVRVESTYMTTSVHPKTSSLRTNTRE